MSSRFLSKSKYLAGLQCEKRLWLQCHQPNLGTAFDASSQAVLDAGNEVGEAARLLFPGGVLVDEPPWEHEAAVRRTRDLMADASVPAIFEAAFEHAGVRIRVDALERLPERRWGLREVKSAASVKDPYLDDLAVQRFVLGGNRVRLGSVELVHVNSEYVRGVDGIDWQGFFERADCAEDAERRLQQLRRDVKWMHAVVARSEAPGIEPGEHCSSPYGCEFWEHCTREKPDDWIFRLPRIGGKRLQELLAGGHDRIRNLPDDVQLTSLQQRYRNAIETGEPFVSPKLPAVLKRMEPPVWFLDFEAIFHVIPLYPGGRPYQQIPFQWSLHHLDGEGALTHQEFLADGLIDPRSAFADSLIEALEGDEAPIVVYSSFEATQLKSVAEAYPHLTRPLERIRRRLVDLLPIVRQHVYHPDFNGSFSLKAVGPALVPGFGYDDLEDVSEGSAASAAFVQIARRELAPDAEASLRQSLLTYCGRDTLALVKVAAALGKLCESRT